MDDDLDDLDAIPDPEDVLPPWGDVDRVLPDLDGKPRPRGRDRSYFEVVCSVYGREGDDTCVDDLVETERRALGLPLRPRVELWSAAFRRHGIDANVRVRGRAHNSPPRPQGDDVVRGFKPAAPLKRQAAADEKPCDGCPDDVSAGFKPAAPLKSE